MARPRDSGKYVSVSTRLAALLAAASTITVACTGTTSAPQVGTPDATTPPPLTVEVVADGLEHGWDIGFLPDGRVLVTQRPAQIALVSGTAPGSTVSQVEADLSDVYIRGESGLMGLVVHPDFATSRRFTTCLAHQENGRAVDVRLVTWELSPDGNSARRVVDPLLAGLPLNPSGRHAGCRLELAADGSLLVGTGDSARNGVPQDRTNLGGKVLHIDLATGEPAPGNPFADSPDPRERLVWTYGHRNVQGLALRPGTEQVFSAEHGPDRDDEVNLLRPGGHYGWAPVGDPTGYDESVPMTDTRRFPDAVPAVWSTGNPTLALCAVEFLSGPTWGDLDGMLVATSLKGKRLVLLDLDQSGAVRQVVTPPELNDRYGRLRAARLGPDGALYLTTSNGHDDRLLRVTRS